MLNIKKQISRLYLSSVLGNLSLTGAWVAILAARGYSLVEIGFAETVFHITSLIFEIPSGVLADLFGRKNMLLVSNIMRMIGSMWKEFAKCFITSLSFLKNERNTVLLMLCNSLVGAVDILLLFFLQARLPEAGMPSLALGVALFFMEMGGILGAKIILKCKKLRYRSVFTITLLLVLSGVIVEHSGMYVIMTLGGFAAAFGDDALQVRTNTILQDMFPSEQRATLISIESFIFSMIMIVMSPFAGVLFLHW